VTRSSARTLPLVVVLVVVLVGGVVPGAAAVPEVAGPVRLGAAVARPTVLLAVSSARPRAGERVWLAVRVTGTTKVAGRDVVVEERHGTRWSRITRARSSASGRLTVHAVVGSQDAFRARLLDAGGSRRPAATRAVVVSRA